MLPFVTAKINETYIIDLQSIVGNKLFILKHFVLKRNIKIKFILLNFNSFFKL